VKFLHVPIALDLSLVAVDTTFHLACERKQILVDDLGGLAVPLVLLRLLNVGVDITLRLEPVSTALIRAGEWSLAGVVHHMRLQVPGSFECCRAARVGAGEPWRGSVLASDVLLQVASTGKSCSTIRLFADERSLSQVHGIVVSI